MPELPDLTVFVGNLNTLALGKTVTQADIFNVSKVSATKEEWRDKLVGQTVAAIARDGKETAFTFSSGFRFHVHLMLAGRFIWGAYDQIFAINSKIITLGFEGGDSLTVCDSMRKATVRVNPKKAMSPDVFDEAFTEDAFLAAAQKHKTKNVKDFLTDQSILRGIGNAYADEILYAANISPLSYMIRIPENRLRDLYRAIHDTLNDAIARLTQLTPNAIAGEERSFLKIHTKKKEFTDRGEEILSRSVGRQFTYYTREQELFL